MKRNLTDRFVRSLKRKAAPKGKRVEFWDPKVTGFGLRLTEKGHRTYVLYARFPGSPNSSRREIGNADRVSLAAARKRAREWLEMIELGRDPQAEERAAEAAERARRLQSFEIVADAWFARIKHQRKAEEVERDVRREFVERWRSRPVTSITRQEVAQIIEDKAEGRSPAPLAKKKGPAPAQARNLLGSIKQLFAWAVASGKYGLDNSPAQLVQGKAIYGPKKKRKRWLTDEEIRAVWQAADQLGYPYGPCVKLLLMSGQRKAEVAEAVWSEFDLRQRLWIIPRARMKKEHDHLVPLTEDMVALLKSLPRFREGDHLFTTTFGARPANGWSKAKERIDAITGPLPHWTIHDLRRTVRTNLSRVEVPDRVCEVIVAHNSGMHAVYDLWTYEKQKREALGKWCALLRRILQRRADNVVPMRG